MRKNYKKHIGVILFILCVFLISLNILNSFSEYKIQNKNRYANTLSITTSDNKLHSFNLLLADTDELREKGLGDRTSLDPRDAMLFVFQDNTRHFFWMKDMEFPIDIVWLNTDKKVIHIEKGVATSTYPNPFGPQDNSQYVIEYNAGISDEIRLNEGDKINF